MSPDPKAMNHLISIADSPFTQEIPRIFEAMYWQVGTNPRYILYYSTIYRFAFSENFIYMELCNVHSSCLTSFI